ncbi:sulfotransferase [Rhodovulum sp. DZ06]|uniref:sulfotransferase n=1 Tax=Rhodovulum sp. DZ06 TaxID=3425126 RepID=UPI003D35970F
MTDRPGMVDAMVIGAQKAGTTWLWEALRRRADVFTPPVKELHHYDHRHIPANRAWTHRHLRRGVRQALRWHVNRANPFDRDWIDYLVDLADRAPFTQGWYARAFARAPAGALRLDVTPEYASLPPEGAAEAVADNPGLKVVHVLRDPVDRALSQVRMGFARRKLAAPGREDWAQALADPDLADRSDYARHLATWGAALPPDRILRLNFSMLRDDPAALLDRVEGFFELPPAARPAGFADAVHAGPRIEAPAWVRADLDARLAPQRAAMARALAAAQPPRLRTDLGPGLDLAPSPATPSRAGQILSLVRGRG